MEAPAQELLEKSITEAFAPFLSERESGSRRIIRASLPYGKPLDGLESTTPYHLVDRDALLKGMIADGVAARLPDTSSQWLADALRRHGMQPELLLQADHVAPAIEMTVVASDSLKERILPAARASSRATSQRDDFHSRHLCFALLDDLTACPLERSPLETSLLEVLRGEFLERCIELYPIEAEAWRRLGFTSQTRGRRNDRVRTLSDAPATVDSLGRDAFAQVLAARIAQIGAELKEHRPSGDAAFILHMDGPWGSGKSTILNFLRAKLEMNRPPWLVIQFNAWRNQNRKPAWWPLLLEVRAAAVRSLSWRSPLVIAVWLWWRLRMDWLSYILAALLLGAAGWLVASAAPAGSIRGLLSQWDGVLKSVGAVLATVGSFLAMARGFTLGSRRNAEAYFECKSEPFQRVIRLFGFLVRAVGRPIAVFVDDLDRCDGNYVIELLEGIQTSLRAEPIVYVVSGDRKWICSSFEKRYADFCSEIGTPGRPLGYLFLDKIFQASTTVPLIPATRQAKFWGELLERNPNVAQKRHQARGDAASGAAALLAGATSEEEMRAAIQSAQEGSLERETLQAQAAIRSTSAEATKIIEHRLQPLACLLEANPRAMKRLVNAYGLNRAVAYLEGRDISVEALARWTIIELRWPKLADHLAMSWRGTVDTEIEAVVPESLRSLVRSREVRAVIGSDGDEGRLSPEELEKILG